MPINVSKQIEAAMERGESTNLPGERQTAQVGYESLPDPASPNGEPTLEREWVRASMD